MKGKTATVIGATGLIGSHLVELLQDDQAYSTIKVIVRRAVTFNHPKIQVILIDFSDQEALRSAIAGSDAVFCAAGTTQKKVKGDLEAYRRVDYDIPVNAARHCAGESCLNYLLVSSVGANSKGNNFYIKLKGEVEDMVKTIGIPCVHIFRPSMLLGKRAESRPAEKIAQVIMKGLSCLVPSKFKPIPEFDS
jgi:uncharacterized protein YbjT (DUF2867 family)